MKDFKKMYYINNIPWQRNLDYNRTAKFNSIRYGDTIVFHFDFDFSLLKTAVIGVSGYNKKMFVSAINACLRYYQIIKNIYPYNKVGIIIHLNSKTKLSDIFDVLQAIVDIIPNIAVDRTDNTYFDDNKHKHIFYGGSSNKYPKQLKTADYQIWSVFKGKLIIKEGIRLEQKKD